MHTSDHPGSPDVRRLVGTLICCVGLAVSLIGTGIRAGAAAPVPAPEAGQAIDWLAAQLSANGGSMPGFTPGSSEWGVTADAVLAFVAAGRASDPAATDATDHLAANATAFTTWVTDDGFTVRDAGTTAKIVLTLRSMGRAASAGGVDLEAALRSLMETVGDQAGRFSDQVPEPSWNASNGFAQALAMLGLALTPDGIPPAAVSFLLHQQCPSGGFRLTYSSTSGCTTDAAADTDATALSLAALLAAPRTPTVTTALRAGTTWLLSRQAADGSFGGTGPTAAANTNSTGLIAQYLRAAGETAAADRAAAWIVGCCQLSTANSTGSPAAGHAGAIAYDPSAFATGVLDGITAQAGDQWRRTTTQAVLGLGLAPYGPQSVEPLPPVSVTTTSTTTSPTTTTTAPTTTSPMTTSPSVAPNSTPAPGTATTGVADATVEAAGQENPPSATTLASTGSDPRPVLGVGVMLLAAGAASLVASGRRRR